MTAQTAILLMQGEAANALCTLPYVDRLNFCLFSYYVVRLVN